MKNFWISWNAPESMEFDLESPWWVTGKYHGGSVVSAAIKADDVASAKEAIYRCYVDHPGSLRFLSVTEKPEGWGPWDAPEGQETPFQREDWMVW
jgi:hypothetical protein